MDPQKKSSNSDIEGDKISSAIYQKMAKFVLILGIGCSLFLWLLSLHWLATLFLLICCISSADFMWRAKKARDQEELLKKAREGLSEQLGSALAQYQAEQVHSRELEELANAGVELYQKAGVLNGKPIYLYAKKDGKIFEYDGVVWQGEAPLGYLVINGLVYKPQSP